MKSRGERKNLNVILWQACHPRKPVRDIPRCLPVIAQGLLAVRKRPGFLASRLRFEFVDDKPTCRLLVNANFACEAMALLPTELADRLRIVGFAHTERTWTP